MRKKNFIEETVDTIHEAIKLVKDKNKIIIKKEGKYWIDGNNNKWSIDKYTKEKAEMHSKDCSDCSNCIDCVGCSDCHNCYDCNLCCDCSDCYHCFNCAHCFNLKYCNACYHCSGCVSAHYYLDCNYAPE